MDPQLLLTAHTRTLSGCSLGFCLKCSSGVTALINPGCCRLKGSWSSVLLWMCLHACNVKLPLNNLTMVNLPTGSCKGFEGRWELTPPGLFAVTTWALATELCTRPWRTCIWSCSRWASGRWSITATPTWRATSWETSGLWRILAWKYGRCVKRWFILLREVNDRTVSTYLCF